MRTRLAIAAAVLCTLVFAGCTDAVDGGQASDSSSPPTDDSSAKTIEEWTVDADLIGGIPVQLGTAVAYTRAENGMKVTAWDALTGDELWSAAAHPGGAPTGFALTASTLAVDGTAYVAYLRETSVDASFLIVADARTGRQVQLSHEMVDVHTRPRSCADELAFCFLGSVAGLGTFGNYRVDPASGVVERDLTTSAPSTARFLSDRVYASNDRGDSGEEKLGFLGKDGGTAWERRYQEVFGPDTSSDFGWSWDDEGEVLVGVGHAELASVRVEYETTGRALWPQDNARMVGLDAATGATLWQLDGVDRCPRMHPSDPSTAAEQLLVCRYTSGSYEQVRDSDGPLSTKTPRDFDVDVLAIDRATGAIRWEVPLDASWFVASNSTSMVTSWENPVLPSGGEMVRVDPATGATTALDAGARLICRAAREPLTVAIDGKPKVFTTGESSFPCNASGSPTASFDKEALDLVGIPLDADGRVIEPESRATEPDGTVNESGGDAAHLYLVAGPDGIAALRLDRP